MRKIFLLLSLVSVLGACQKKQYATFNYQNSASYVGQKSVATAQKDQESLVETAAPEILSASANEVAPLMTPAEVAASRIPAEAVTRSAAPVQAKTTSSTIAKPIKLTLTQKLISKKIQKQTQKENSPEVAKAAKAEDTMSLLALIFGGAGLVMLLATSAGTLGLLLGIAGLVLGIIGMQRVKKGQAPASSKILALLGLILGGLVTLIGLIAVADYYGN